MALDSNRTGPLPLLLEGVSRTGALPVGLSCVAALMSNSGMSMSIPLYSAAMRILKARKEPAGVWRVYDDDMVVFGFDEMGFGKKGGG